MSDRGQLNKHIQALDKGDDAARRQAIQALRNYEEKDWASLPIGTCHDVVMSLRRQISDSAPPPHLLKDAVIILGRIGPRSKSAVPQLIALLSEGTVDAVREAVVTALGNIGKDARDAVDSLLELAKGHKALAALAIQALARIGCADHRVRSALVNQWLSPLQTQNGQLQLAMALCRLKIPAKGSLEYLTHHLMASSDGAVRKATAAALAWCNKNDRDVVPALLAASLADKDEEVRQIAQASLDRLRLSPENAISCCTGQLQDSVYAETALRRSGARAVAALKGALSAKESVTRLKAARTLGDLGEVAVDAAPALATVLRDRDAQIRLTAAKSLWNITKKPDLAVPALVQLLDEKRFANGDDGEFRRQYLQSVIEALWRIGAPAKAAVQALVAKTKDQNRLVRESAQYALNRINVAKAS